MYSILIHTSISALNLEQQNKKKINACILSYIYFYKNKKCTVPNENYVVTVPFFFYCEQSVTYFSSSQYIVDIASKFDVKNEQNCVSQNLINNDW